ncbi:MAG: PaaI family thioesterase [Deltaproteobacteria bacterium]|nr:MAG: PaaI family thioesterase [Deltaproteobacteria bacterium]
MAVDPQAVAQSMPFARALGIEVTAAVPDEVRGGLDWTPERCTTGGVLHGAALMALGDTLGAICAFLNLPAGAATTTIESKTNFFRAVRGGRVEAVTRPLHVGRRVIVVQTDVTEPRGIGVGVVHAKPERARVAQREDAQARPFDGNRRRPEPPMVRVNRPAQRSVADPEGAVLYLQVTRTARATTSSPASASTARG